jgi:hypothetical protein
MRLKSLTDASALITRDLVYHVARQTTKEKGTPHPCGAIVSPHQVSPALASAGNERFVPKPWVEASR